MQRLLPNPIQFIHPRGATLCARAQSHPITHMHSSDLAFLSPIRFDRPPPLPLQCAPNVPPLRCPAASALY